MRKDLVVGGALVLAAWFSGRMEYLNAKNKYERMVRYNNARTKLMVDLGTRVQHLRAQREEALSLHVGDASRRCVTCEQLFPCQTWQALRASEPNIDLP